MNSFPYFYGFASARPKVRAIIACLRCHKAVRTVFEPCGCG
jgi:hypothetical protein